jgi:hypothetical protein
MRGENKDPREQGQEQKRVQREALEGGKREKEREE